MITLQKWVPYLGWQFVENYPDSDSSEAYDDARCLEDDGVPMRMFISTPEGPEILCESLYVTSNQ